MDITLDASAWAKPSDFYTAWITAVGGPKWHGHSLDALIDGLRGGINRIDPPLTLTLANASAAAKQMPQLFQGLDRVFQDARSEGLTVRLILT